MPREIPEIYMGLLGHWPGMLLYALSVIALGLAISGAIFSFHEKTEVRDKFLNRILCYLKFVEEAAPTVGLIGTIYGLIGGLFSVKPEHIPFFIAVALYTTYIGGMIFLFSMFVRTMLENRLSKN
jgi:biopolymer transport protein ExbB/TolQ